MVGKRAVRKQQNTSRIETNLQPVAEAFEAAVARCVHDADGAAVHRMRTGSRRMQAMVECTLREAGPACESFKKPAQVWLRQLKKIRRAAGPVRDLDVQRALIQVWISAAHPLNRQAQELDEWLRIRRKEKAQAMQKQIGKRQQRLAEQQASLFRALPALRLSKAAAVRPADALAMDHLVRAAEAMPRIDAQNLHDFRKACKKARYVAEAGSAKPTRVAKALKRIQDAIGAWHDWHCLQEDAGEVLSRTPELRVALAREVERHFSAAIRISETMRGRLLGEWLAVKRPSGSATIANRRRA